MTNKDKYLKDNVSVEELAGAITKELSYFDDLSYYSENMEQAIIEFLNEQAKPLLTEDERVILRNLPKQIKKIRRDKYKVKEPDMNYGMLEMVEEDNKYWTAPVLSHLFQFIKERRRI